MYHYVVHFENGDVFHVEAANFSVLEAGEILFSDANYNAVRYERGVLKVIGTLIV